MPATPSSRETEVLRALAERIDRTDAGAFNNLGVLYHSKGMYEEAVDALLHAIALDPRMATAIRNLEVAAECGGACDCRLHALAERVAADADDRDAAREQARLLRLIGRHTEAAQKLDALIAEDPDDAQALLERGLVEQRAGDLRRAQRWFERASNADSANLIARLQLAEVMYQRGHNEQALVVLDALLAVDERLADAHLLRGFVLGDMGQHEAGMEAARTAAALKPTLATLQPNLSLRSIADIAVSAQRTRTTDNATTDVTRGETPRYGLGLAFRQRGYFAEARQEFARAIDGGEDVRLARHAIAETDLITGRPFEAADAYRSLITTHGESARWCNELAVALHQQRELNEAAEWYRRALRNDPRYSLAYNNLGVALADLGETIGACEAFQHALTIDATLVRARLNLARSLAASGESTGALFQLRELVSFHPDNAEAWHDMALVLIAFGRLDDAHRALAACVNCQPNADVNAASARRDSAHSRAVDTLATLFGETDELGRSARLVAVAEWAREPRALSLGIELQIECPETAGTVNLLAIIAEEGVKGASLEQSHEAQAEVVCGDVAPWEQEFDVVPESATDESWETPDRSEETRSPRDGDTYAARGEHAEALHRYREVRTATEWSGPRELWKTAAIGEARSLCLLGRGHEALELIEHLLQESTESANDMPELLALLAAAHGAAFIVAGADGRLARAAIAQFLRTESRSAALLHFVGDVAMSIGEDALAVVLFRRALAVDPMRPTPRVAIARLLRRRNDVLAARLELVAALAVAPQLREALLELAALHCDARRPVEALRILISHLQRDATDVEALALLAHALLLVGRESDARHAMVHARRVDPTHSFASALQERLHNAGSAVTS